MQRLLARAAVAALSVMLLLPAASTAPVKAASTSPFSFNWAGGLTAPVIWNGQGANTWDVQIHKRDVGDSMDVMDAQHGPDCAPPPAVHTISVLSDGVYICKNHVMTAINDGGYGEIALTSDHMVDFSGGTATIKVDVSTLDLNPSDWIEVWLTPFADNLTTPTTFGAQGPPAHGLRFALSSAFLPSAPGDVTRIDNFGASLLPRTSAVALSQLLAQSATVRSTFEIDVSQTHVRFGMPTIGGGTWWTDTDIASLPFTQAVVSLTHHSYDAPKHCPSCGVDTWHWSNFSISTAVPFTIIDGNERSINPGGATTVHFPAAAPANAYLRFSGIGPIGSTYMVSYDGGASWVSPAVQNQRPGAHEEVFSTYFTPIPAGTQTVMYQGKNWWGGPWWVRDPAIWSAQGVSPVQNPPTNPPTNPPSEATPLPGPESGSGAGRTGETTSPPPPIRGVLTRLVAAVNPTQDPTITVILILLALGVLVAVYRVIRA